MAVVNRKGLRVIANLDALPNVYPPIGLNGGHVRYFTDKLEISSGDSANSTFTIARLPYNAIIIPINSFITHDAITSVTDADLGTTDDPNALADAVDISSAGSFNALEQVDAANYYKPLWELCGLTEDPRTLVDINLTINNNAGAAGTITGQFLYVTD